MRQTALHHVSALAPLYGPVNLIQPAAPLVGIAGLGLEIVMRDLASILVKNRQQILSVQIGAVNEFTECRKRRSFGFGRGFVSDALVRVS